MDVYLSACEYSYIYMNVGAGDLSTIVVESQVSLDQVGRLVIKN